MSEVQTTASKQVQASIVKLIAEELKARPEQVIAAIQLLDEGATVPFISRYRKEVTGGLDDTQLRTLEERLGYLRELEDRRAAVIESVEQLSACVHGEACCSKWARTMRLNSQVRMMSCAWVHRS